MEERRLKEIATGREWGTQGPQFSLVYLHKYTDFACYYLPLE